MTEAKNQSEQPESMEIVTPVGRLLRIINVIRKQPEETHMYKVWLDVFELPDDIERVDMYPHLQALRSLLNECTRVINEYTEKDMQDRYKTAISPFLAMHNIDTYTQVNQIKSRISVESLTLLEVCDTELKRKAFENDISKEEIDKIIQAVQQLMDQVTTSNIDDKIAALCVQLLNSVRNSLYDYKVIGVDSIENTLVRELSSIKIVFDSLDDKKVEKPLRDIFRKLGGLVDKSCKTYAYIVTVNAIAAKGHEVASIVAEEVLSLTPPS